MKSIAITILTFIGFSGMASAQVHWTMHDYDAMRTSWVQGAATFAPPFQKIVHVFSEPLASEVGIKTYMLSYADSKLYLGLGAGNLGNAVCRYDHGAGLLEWLTQVPGGGGSIGNTPVITGNRIIAGGQGGGAYLTAFDRNNGMIMWKKPVGSMYTISGTLEGGNLYVCVDSVYCLNPENGDVIWKDEHIWSQGATPAIYGDFMAHIKADTLIVRNKNTGARLWSQPGVSKEGLTIDAERVYIAGPQSVKAFRLSDGEPAWTHAIPEAVNLGWLSWNALARDNTTLLYALWNDPSSKGVVRALNLETGAEVWTYTSPGSGINAMTIVNGLVYIVEWEYRAMTALSMTDGTVVFRDTQDPYYTRVIYGDGKLFVALIPDPLVGGAVVEYIPTGTIAEQPPAPAAASINIYPNPVRDHATISYTIETAAYTTVSVYDALGREVVSLDEGLLNPGTHVARIDISKFLHPSAPGLYTAIVRSGNSIMSKRIIVTQ